MNIRPKFATLEHSKKLVAHNTNDHKFYPKAEIQCYIMTQPNSVDC